jgi:uncharacterized protein
MTAFAVDDAIRAHILERLAEVEHAHDVRVLFAVESGSRAWGFPSPDSDYDVRFIYAHPVPWYLSLREERDVIERPLDDRLVDLGGWDVRKALRLLLKSNAVLYEWCCSPIVYRDDGYARAELKALFEQAAGPQAIAYHYRETARTTWVRMMEGRDEVRLKRYFYVVRPLLALEWVMARRTPPPMRVQELLAGHPLPPAADAAFAALTEMKRKAPEVGEGARLPALDAWIVPRLAAAPKFEPADPGYDSTGNLGVGARSAADRIFLTLIGVPTALPPS